MHPRAQAIIGEALFTEEEAPQADPWTTKSLMKKLQQPLRMGASVLSSPGPRPALAFHSADRAAALVLAVPLVQLPALMLSPWLRTSGLGGVLLAIRLSTSGLKDVFFLQAGRRTAPHASRLRRFCFWYELKYTIIWTGRRRGLDNAIRRLVRGFRQFPSCGIGGGSLPEKPGPGMITSPTVETFSNTKLGMASTKHSLNTTTVHRRTRKIIIFNNDLTWSDGGSR